MLFLIHLSSTTGIFHSIALPRFWEKQPIWRIRVKHVCTEQMVWYRELALSMKALDPSGLLCCAVWRFLKWRDRESVLSLAADVLSGSKTGGFRSKLPALYQWVEKALRNTLLSFKEGSSRRKASDATGTVTVWGSILRQRAKADGKYPQV